MPRCAVCQSLLPPEFLELTEDGKAKKCVFCIRGTDSIEYFSESEDSMQTTTKAETMKEYVEFLKEASELPNVKNIIEAIKERQADDHIS